MYYQLYLHRPRTQRIGVNAYPRDIFIAEFEKKQDVIKLQNKLLAAHSKQIEAGYPWPYGLVDFTGGRIQLQPNDRFFITLTFESTKRKYEAPYEETAEELVDIALNNLVGGIIPE